MLLSAFLATEDFVGNFRRTGVDEPLPTKVPETPEVDLLVRAIQRLKK